MCESILRLFVLCKEREEGNLRTGSHGASFGFDCTKLVIVLMLLIYLVVWTLIDIKLENYQK